MNYLNLGYNTQLATELDDIAKYVADIMKCGIAKGAASIVNPVKYKLPSDQKSVERLAVKFLANQHKSNSKNAKHFRTKLNNFVNSSSARKGRYVDKKLTSIKFPSSKSVTKQAAKFTSAKTFKLPKRMGALIKAQMRKPSHNFVPKMLQLAEVCCSVPQGSPSTKTDSNPDYSQLRLNIISVLNIQSTSWEPTDFFNDEIAIGGLGADSTGQERRINPFDLGEFRTGQRKNFVPPRQFVSFDLTNQGHWPRQFSVTMAMAEKDINDGFIQFLLELWKIIDEVVVQLASAAVGAIVGTAIGASLSGGTAALIGAIVGAVIGYVVGWLIDSLKDDVFNPVNFGLIIPAPNTPFLNGTNKSDRMKTQFNNESAIYELTYEWELV